MTDLDRRLHAATVAERLHAVIVAKRLHAATLAERLHAAIVHDGPMRLDHWMAACNAAYYAGRDPFGAGGDFVTAPEISQMFGEMIGGWIGDLWQRAGSPAMRLVELGPGRGTLMADALRVAGRLPGFARTVGIALVETSPRLRAAQGKQVEADWFDSLDQVPDDLPMVLVANEFFDALPIRQFGPRGETAVTTTATGFAATTLPAARPPGESCEAGCAIAATIGDRLRTRGGAALVIDYGYADAAAGDSLQAVRDHAPVDPFGAPGSADLTAHVDFSALARAAGDLRTAGDLRVSGPVPQGVWLARLGIEARAATLRRGTTPARAAQVEAALVRLTAPAQMGTLFKAMALSAHGWPVPAGFDK